VFVKTNKEKGISNVADLPLEAIAASIQKERQRVGWSMGGLAKRAGVAKSTLSQLESAAGNPSLETLWALATALGIPFAQLIGPPQVNVTVVRAGEGLAVAAESAAYVATLLSPAPPGSRRDIYRVSAAPGSRRESDPHPVGTVEHLLLCNGQALVGPVADPVLLDPGDFITYPGDAGHVFEAQRPDTWAMLVSEQR
jgi:transcriptional regulator with XRE-family HTH domain